MQRNQTPGEASKPGPRNQVPVTATQLTPGQIQTLARLNRGQSSTGVVGLSCVSAESLQQVLQNSPLTLVTAVSPDAVSVLNQQGKQSLLQQHQSGATIHHLGSKDLASPISNQNANMSNTKQSVGASLMPAPISSPPLASQNTSTIPLALKIGKLPFAATMPTNKGSASPASVGPSPKKMKLEEKPVQNSKVASLRQSVSSHKRSKMRVVKAKYRENLTELFYLQVGGNMVEFQTWKKRPTPPLLNFLAGSRMEGDDEEERLQEKRINDEVKVLTSTGSNIPIATPVAIATTLPPSVSALSQQAMHSSTVTASSLTTCPPVTASASELQQHLTQPGDTKTQIHKGSTSQSNQPITAKSIKSQSTSPGRSRQAIASVYENVTGSQDVIVERAKQEAQVIQRVNELRKDGMWTAKRLPRVQEPPRQKAHWDYLLEEMTWLAGDFIQERKWKKATSKKIARMIANHFREREMKELKAEKEEAIKLKKIASQMSKMVKEFWNNIEKVVQYKQTTRLEEKKKKALDLHLSFIVDQTEKYSSWLTAGLQSAENTSKASSIDSFDGNDAGDAEFQPMGTASDDEETIEKEENEAGYDGDGAKEELEALQKESELPLEEILKGLPQEMLDMPSKGLDFEDGTGSTSDKDKDGDFDIGDEDDQDEEETLEEQEKHDKDYTEELGDLKAEGEMSVEELMKKYAGAYDSDFEMPESSDEGSSGDDDDDDDEASSGSEKETGESEDEEMIEDDDQDSLEDVVDTGKEAVGLDYLVQEEEKAAAPQEGQANGNGPGKEFNDIAAAAQSLQPKGYTLETTEVKTKVPFLLKHTLREYQHVGLDWLATMHDKRLNGILADEMGLGKTIQTIALLAHLACEKGIWGPHLIVVPTSVMLNWEMEIKKWCPAFKILTYYGSIKERKLKRQGWTKTNAFHVCITSYKLVVQDHQAFRRKKWKYFILDEAQNIKNFKSQRWQMLLNFSSQRRLLLTGTPLQNSLMELWSLMHFLMPNVFQSHSEFKEWFSNPLTGMIEGSQEYNESLVRRLHKVLRPFLLRRLKNEVEKQMPQKFEHVVMCRLSKRQRYLYDDFMSQTKTKETLATGHFMSVINILMQLRKVCNHPNLFDPRPVVSPFKIEGIMYRTASLVANALTYDPFRDIDMYCLYPSLVDMEINLPAFVAERIRRLQAPGKLIEEIDSWPAPEPRPPPGQLKNLKFSSSASIQNDTMTPGSLSSRSSSAIKATVAPTIQSSASSMNSIKLLLPSSTSSSSPSAQQSILIPNPSGSGPPIILPIPASTTASGVSSVSSNSAAIAQAKLISSQLQSGLLHLVQTSSGHQIIAVASTSGSSSTRPATALSTLSSASSSSSPSSNVSVLKVSSSFAGSQDKPIMKVTPFVVSSSSSTDSGSSTSTTTTFSKKSDTSCVSKLLESRIEKVPKKPVNRSELFLESLYRKKEERRRHMLVHMARVNHQRCSVSPVVGSDTRVHLNCFQHLSGTNSDTLASSSSNKGKTESTYRWRGDGHANCLFAQDRIINHNHPSIHWRECKHLVQAVHSPMDHIDKLKDILHRFVFVTPPVIAPNVEMHISHPDPSLEAKRQWCHARIKPLVQEKSTPLHPIQLRTLVQFPEPRLIQYDCGKLQTMDVLLRKLKSGQHRVLIFTQMTKMLDVLEAFLNFHGHRYLRLDGTTKVEQRQFLMDRFNADARIFCFILSTRSGGVGVNLTGADTVIFYDSDWNPTMDAQAQDRCHRIGQTRDVHIYRLVSEMTVEENILKKANQKRLLGDLAIEGGNFTTAFFKQQTITDLFAEPSGLESLMEAKEERAKAVKSKVEAMETEEVIPKQPETTKKASKKEDTKKESAMLNQFEQALSKAEDEPDVQAVKQVKAEQKAELAEFDENIPWDEREAEIRREEEEVSKVEMELAMLDKELTPIERYAVLVVEAQTEIETAEELKMAEEDIENSKKDWELARLKALKEEEERKAELEEDEMLYIYSKDESQVKNKLGKKAAKRGPKPKAKRSMTMSDPESECVSPSRTVKDKQSSPKCLSKSKLIKKVKKAVKVVDKSGRPKGKPGPGRPRKIVEIPVGNEPIKPKKKVKEPKGKFKKGKNETTDGEVEAKKVPKKKSVVGTDGEVEAKKVSKKKSTVGIKTNKVEGDKLPAKEKKDSKPSTPKISLVNGHGPELASKLTTQARNALLKKQALQAGRIDIGKANDQVLKSPTAAAGVRVAPNAMSPPLRMPVKSPSTPKTPPDPSIPPPWSNPNLVIRTRKAAMHSPVVLTRVQSPVQVTPTTPVLQQSLTRLPAGLTVSGAGVTGLAVSGASVAGLTVSGAGIRIQGNDRNIFQLFNSNTGGIRLAPAIRQITSGPVVNQLQGATLINPASLVNTASLSGARFITTRVAGNPSSIIATGTKASTINVAGGNLSTNIALVPTVLSPARGQTILTQQGTSTAALVNQGGETRTVLNTARLGSPITLQGVGGVPVAVNLIKTNTGITTVPIRQQLFQASSLAPISGNQSGGYVLITPRPRITAPGVGVARVQAAGAGPVLQNTRLVLAQMPAGTVVQQPRAATVVNGISATTTSSVAPAQPKKSA